MGLRRVGEVLIWDGGPVPPGTHAITLGPLVIVKRGVLAAAGGERLMRHEAVHLRQYRERGVIGFVVAYVGSYLRWRLRGYGHWAAYRRIPFEVEADWESRQP
ncbi:MAG TPA: hypothetical protein VMY34_10740 [Acidimicrobiales bacterium]|nr:hypothetical protein [Acidimicrobiales bacterium]